MEVPVTTRNEPFANTVDPGPAPFPYLITWMFGGSPWSSRCTRNPWTP